MHTVNVVYMLLQELWFLKSLTTSFYELVYSPKAVDGTTASYILQLLLRTSCTQFNHLLQEFHKGILICRYIIHTLPVRKVKIYPYSLVQLWYVPGTFMVCFWRTLGTVEVCS